ncbi:IS66 family insertion sequence element accessory protein TnpA [Cerasicoccus maritimus]|uniref:IS66 family insertion sequence element accessory protein TnpA n=1 Tax=Cerasicoccus maritimus TaxID=490089 RepID=UPI0028528962|nr:hypothetical protein [Cerasicoccus maritimus]
MTDTIDKEAELLKVDVLGRVTMPPEKREVILDEFERSGMSGQAFAEHIGVNYQTFATWVQKRRRERGEYPALKKVGCKVKAKKGKRSSSVSLVEAVLESPVSGHAGVGLELEAPGGIKLRVSRREDIALAVELLRALKA